MKKYIISILIIGIMLFSACGNRKNDNVDFLTEYSEVTSETVINQDDSSVEEITEDLDYSNITTFINQSYNKEISATVDKEGYDYLSRIYIAEYNRVTDQYLSDMSSKIFDNGAFDIETPFLFCNSTELEIIADQYDEIEDKADENRYVNAELRYILEDAMESIVDEQPVIQTDSIIREGITSCFGIDVPMKAARITGNIDGKKFEMHYKEIRDEWNIDFFCVEPNYGYNNNFKMDCDIYDSLHKNENLCDEDAARKVADDFVLKLGYKDYTEIQVNKRACYDQNEEDYCYNGYRFLYIPYVDGIKENVPTKKSQIGSVIYTTDDINKVDISLYDRFTFKFGETYGAISDYKGNFIYVDVDETGVVRAKICTPYRPGEEIADNISKLSIDAMINRLASIDRSMLVFTDFEEPSFKLNIFLTYDVVEYENNKVYMPVWVAEDDDQIFDCLDKRRIIGINAVDGDTYFYDSCIYSTPVDE